MKIIRGLGTALLLLLLHSGSAWADGRTAAASLMLKYAYKIGEEVPLHITAALVARWLETHVPLLSDHPEQGPNQPSPSSPTQSPSGELSASDDTKLISLYSKLCTDQEYLTHLTVDRQTLDGLGCRKADLGFQVIALGDDYKRLNVPLLQSGVMISAVNNPFVSAAEQARELAKEEKDHAVTLLSDYPDNFVTNRLMIGDVIDRMSILGTAKPDGAAYDPGTCRSGNVFKSRKFDVTNLADFDTVRLFSHSGIDIFLPIFRIESEDLRKEVIASLKRGIVPDLRQPQNSPANTGLLWPWKLLVTCLHVR
jgi:hypothetical protein